VSEKWFANKGQIVSLVVQILACFFAGVKAFPDFLHNKFFTVGTLLFVLLVLLVVSSISKLASTIRSQHSHSVVYEQPTLKHPGAPSTAHIYYGSVTAGKSSSTPAPDAPTMAGTKPTPPEKRYSCISGLNHIGMEDGVWVFWKALGYLNAAAVTFKNETNITLRNVIAPADGTFYDDQGHQLGVQMVRLPWVDEKHSNTVFAVGESRTLLIAILANQTDTQFSKPDGSPLAQGNCQVSVRIFVDNGKYMDDVQLTLSTTPYFGITQEVS
jgi:hypothetical protein